MHKNIFFLLFFIPNEFFRYATNFNINHAIQLFYLFNLTYLFNLFF